MAGRKQQEDPIVVFVTVPDRDRGLAMARRVVEERLAACAQVLPGITSIYRWQGAIEEDAEHLILMKSFRGAFPTLCSLIVELHPYDVPQVVAVPATDVLGDYLAWMRSSMNL